MTAKAILLAGLLTAPIGIGVPVFADQLLISAKGCIEPPLGAREHAGDELMKYRIYTRDAIEPSWRREMMRQASSLWFGEVRIRCIVHSDGTVTGETLVVGESASPLFKNVCTDSLKNAPRFKPFSDALIKETGSSYTDDFDFTITQVPDSSVHNELPAPSSAERNSTLSGPE